MMKHFRKQSGLTLVEITFIAVILSVLFGGVFKGRAVFMQSKAHNVDAEIRAVAAAIHTYQDRYGALPGDDPAATTRFSGTWEDTDNGNGDDKIQGNWDSTNNRHESRKIWKHLRGAGLIEGPADPSAGNYQQPTNRFNGIIGIGLSRHSLTDTTVVFAKVPGYIAQLLETMGDDSIPSTGAIKGSRISQTKTTFANTYNSSSTYEIAYVQ